MNILHVNTSDTHGGAARAVYRLHQALLGLGVESRMLVQTRISDDPTVIGPASKIDRELVRIRPDLDQLPLRPYRQRPGSLFHPAWVPSGVLRQIGRIAPDVVHLHWINDGFIRIEDIARINRPVAWSLHDMWPFTGGCHYDGGCGKYLSACGACPLLGSSKPADLSARVFKRKRRAYAAAGDMTVIGVSRWLHDIARGGALLRDKQVVHIPNLIDTKVYRPIKKSLAREMLGLPAEESIILFGALYIASEPRKGFAELCQALPMIRAERAGLLVFGIGGPREGRAFPLPVSYLGTLHDEISLRLAYSAADVMVVPSLQENLSNVIMESLSCGTPVVGFRIGGNPDMVDHMENGYLAEPFDPADLARGIDWVLRHPDPEELARNSRQKIFDCFEAGRVARRYVDLYEEILGAGN
jgi:glycosyltransferase involved in cell wall biosynthesis